MHSETLMFDFDGTIVDTYTISFNLIHQAVPEADDASFKKLFEGDIGKIASGSEKLEEIHFHDRYNQHILEQKIIEGMQDIIPQLANSYRLVIISSSRNKPIITFLKHHRLEQYIEKVYGLDTHPNKSEKCLMALADFKLKPINCLMITDTLGDIRQAQNVGINSIAVSWGIHPAETLRQGNPITILETPFQLRQAIEDYFNEAEEI